ncbi:MAG: hypothetical protein V1853_01485 [bacterium]
MHIKNMTEIQDLWRKIPPDGHSLIFLRTPLMTDDQALQPDDFERMRLYLNACCQLVSNLVRTGRLSIMVYPLSAKHCQIASMFAMNRIPVLSPALPGYNETQTELRLKQALAVEGEPRVILFCGALPIPGDVVQVDATFEQDLATVLCVAEEGKYRKTSVVVPQFA